MALTPIGDIANNQFTALATISWSTAADWDNAVSESGVAHESVTNTDHDDASTIKMGYSYSSPSFAANLAAFYPLHEDSGTTAYDLSGNNVDATYESGNGVGAGGLLNNTAFTNQGNSDEVILPNDATIRFGDNFTIFYWFYYGSNVSEEYTFDDPGHDYWVKFNDDTDDLQFGGGSNVAEVANLPTGSWYGIAAVLNSGTADFYVYNADGTLFGSDTGVSKGSISDSSNDGRIGGYRGGGYNTEANYTDFRMISTPLTQTEVEQLIDVVGGESTLTTATKSFGSTTKPDLQNLVYSLNGESIVLDVIGSPGTGSEEVVSQTLDGSTSYALSWSSGHTDFRVKPRLSTTTPNTSPTISEIELSG